LTSFQKELYEVLHQKNMMVTMDVAVKNEDYDYKQLSAYNDYIILMAYDQHDKSGVAGPISAQKWIEESLGLDSQKN
jgi:spore germination protein YaaH